MFVEAKNISYFVLPCYLCFLQFTATTDQLKNRSGQNWSNILSHSYRPLLFFTSPSSHSHPSPLPSSQFQHWLIFYHSLKFTFRLSASSKMMSISAPPPKLIPKKLLKLERFTIGTILTGTYHYRETSSGNHLQVVNQHWDQTWKKLSHFLQAESLQAILWKNILHKSPDQCHHKGLLNQMLS